MSWANPTVPPRRPAFTAGSGVVPERFGIPARASELRARQSRTVRRVESLRFPRLIPPGRAMGLTSSSGLGFAECGVLRGGTRPGGSCHGVHQGAGRLNGNSPRDRSRREACRQTRAKDEERRGWTTRWSRIGLAGRFVAVAARRIARAHAGARTAGRRSRRFAVAPGAGRRTGPRLAFAGRAGQHWMRLSPPCGRDGRPRSSAGAGSASQLRRWRLSLPWLSGFGRGSSPARMGQRPRSARRKPAWR